MNSDGSYIPNLQPLRKDLLEAAIRYYQALVAKRPDDPSLLADLAIAHMRIVPVYHDFERSHAAVEAMANGLEQIERLRSQFPDAQEDRIRLAGFWKPLRGRGKSNWPKDVDQVTRTLENLVATYTSLQEELPSVEGFESDLAAAHYTLAGWQMHFPDLRLAGLKASEESLARWIRLRTAHPENAQYYDSYLALAREDAQVWFRFAQAHYLRALAHAALGNRSSTAHDFEQGNLNFQRELQATVPGCVHSGWQDVAICELLQLEVSNQMRHWAPKTSQ